MKKNSFIRLFATTVMTLSVAAVLAAPNDARMIAKAALSDKLAVQLVLRTPKEEQLEQIALSAADPDSPRYGRYLSMDEVLSSYGPAPGTAQKVIDYLTRHGISARLDPSGLYVNTHLRVDQAERLADVSLYRFETTDGRRTYLAPTSAARVPEALTPFVDAIIGLNQTPLRLASGPERKTPFNVDAGPKAALSTTDSQPYNSAVINTGSPQGCAEGVSGNGANPYTPNQWLHAYGLDQLQMQGFSGRGERVALIEIDGFYQADLDGFTDCFGLPRQTPSLITVPGGPPLPGPGSETILDLQVLAAVAPGLDEIQIFQSTNGEGDMAVDPASLTRTVLAAITQPSAQGPTVVSISLGWCEAQYTKASFILAERALLRAAASGISVFVSSGDSGVTGCRTEAEFPEGLFTNAAAIISANYPATSPWVTAIGGTNLWFEQDNSVRTELVWNDWEILAETVFLGQPNYVLTIAAGTGGLSGWFPQPKWQSKTSIPGDAFGSFKRARAVPDLSLLADQYPGYAYLGGGTWGKVGGTSAATPLMAGAAAVMNQALRATNQQRLGFLNPLLYAFGNDEQIRGKVYRDIIRGDIDTTWQVFPVQADFSGFSFSTEAKPGYDLASGWGSPLFPTFFQQVRESR